MEIITERAQLVALAAKLGVNAEWHEPDNQRVTAWVRGVKFDNAGFWGRNWLRTALSRESEELHVIIRQGHRNVAAINLATLCAWAADTRQEDYDLGYAAGLFARHDAA